MAIAAPESRPKFVPYGYGGYRPKRRMGLAPFAMGVGKGALSHSGKRLPSVFQRFEISLEAEYQEKRGAHVV